MTKTLTCISCPVGCSMTAEIQPDGSIAVSGNQCARGAQYARDELVDPRRVVTATCATGSAIHPRAPVRSREPCPKDLIPALLEEIYRITVRLPVRQGDIVGTFRGVQIVATRSIS
jgi:CxxC motif-containing protein